MPPTSTERERRLLILPDSLVTTTLRHLHADARHFGINKTLARVEEKFWWPGYTKDVEHWVKECSKCAQRKNPHRRARAALQSIPVGGPMEMLAMDFGGASAGN